jgi:enoyl-CoA hydratase
VSDPKPLLVEREAGIATLTLNRPEALNALSRVLRRALAEAFRSLSADAGCGVVILTGRGRAFSAGVDLKEIGGESGTDSPGALFEDSDPVAAMRACPLPIIGAVNGFAITGGFELALACDVLVASSGARFADTHARVGIAPGWGLSQLLPRWIGPSRAKELSFTGNFLDAETALAWGLVNRVVAPDELLPSCRRLAQDMLSCDRATLLRVKRVYDEGLRTTLAEGFRVEARAAIEHARSVRPEHVAARRRALQDRGRSQSGA